MPSDFTDEVPTMAMEDLAAAQGAAVAGPGMGAGPPVHLGGIGDTPMDMGGNPLLLFLESLLPWRTVAQRRGAAEPDAIDDAAAAAAVAAGVDLEEAMAALEALRAEGTPIIADADGASSYSDDDDSDASSFGYSDSDGYEA